VFTSGAISKIVATCKNSPHLVLNHSTNAMKLRAFIGRCLVLLASRAVAEQLQSSYGAVMEELRSSFRAVAAALSQSNQMIVRSKRCVRASFFRVFAAGPRCSFRAASVRPVRALANERNAAETGQSQERAMQVDATGWKKILNIFLEKKNRKEKQKKEKKNRKKKKNQNSERSY